MREDLVRVAQFRREFGCTLSGMKVKAGHRWLGRCVRCRWVQDEWAAEDSGARARVDTSREAAW